jgi:hypothetical protein
VKTSFLAFLICVSICAAADVNVGVTNGPVDRERLKRRRQSLTYIGSLGALHQSTRHTDSIAQRPSMWTCSKCTKRNWDTDTTCHYCGTSATGEPNPAADERIREQANRPEETGRFLIKRDDTRDFLGNWTGLIYLGPNGWTKHRHEAFVFPTRSAAKMAIDKQTERIEAEGLADVVREWRLKIEKW